MLDFLITPPVVEPLALSVVKHHLRVEITDDDALIAGLLTAARARAETLGNIAVVAQTHELVADRFPRTVHLWHPPVLAVSSITYRDHASVLQTLTADQYQLDRDNRPARIRPAYGTHWPATASVFNAVRVRYVAGCVIPFTVDVAADTLTTQGHALADAVQLSNSGGALPAPLQARTTYYVVNAVGATCQLATAPAGDPLTLTDAGEGLHFVGAVPPGLPQYLLLLIGHWYEHREAVTDRTYTAVPQASDALLSLFRVEVLD